MDFDLKFIRPFAGTAKAANIFSTVSENKTLMTTEFYSIDKYPFNLMSWFIGRKMIKETQEKNLKNIKQILEKQ